jgi:predicted DCC family thiol-disulfide oxidoreductase YuxK
MFPNVLVIYDADCGVCQASVAWVRRRDRTGAIEFLGNDQPLPASVSPAETEHTIVVLDGDRKLVRAEGTARILRELRGWRWAASLIQALRPLADRGYDAFARRRHRISRALGMRACAMPARRR